MVEEVLHFQPQLVHAYEELGLMERPVLSVETTGLRAKISFDDRAIFPLYPHIRACNPCMVSSLQTHAYTCHDEHIVSRICLFSIPSSSLISSFIRVILHCSSSSFMHNERKIEMSNPTALTFVALPKKLVLSLLFEQKIRHTV